MREWIMLIEGAEKTVPSSHIDDLVMKIHPREDDFTDGDLLHRIDRYDTYKLTYVDIDDLILDEFDIDDEHVDELVELIDSGEDLPPIVFDPIERSIIDGNHRANAYHNAGYKKIKAYVGDSENEDWD